MSLHTLFYCTRGLVRRRLRPVTAGDDCSSWGISVCDETITVNTDDLIKGFQRYLYQQISSQYGSEFWDKTAVPLIFVGSSATDNEVISSLRASTEAFIAWMSFEGKPYGDWRAGKIPVFVDQAASNDPDLNISTATSLGPNEQEEEDESEESDRIIYLRMFAQCIEEMVAYSRLYRHQQQLHC